MASTNVGVQEMPMRPGSFSTDLFPVQIGWEDGYAFAPDRPGLGVEFDEELAESLRTELGGWPPRLRRNDGAFTNW
jgi:L-alanine-DL-glutamate epimerase-like enolase superfamily enzyme